MMYRILAGMIPSVLAALVWTGAIPIGSWFSASAEERTVAAASPLLMSALASTDLTSITQGEMAAGDEPLTVIRRQHGNGHSWTVMMGDRAMADLVAEVEPSADGQGSVVRTRASHAATYDAAGAPLSIQNRSALATRFAVAVEARLNGFAPPGERLTEKQLRDRRLRAEQEAITTQVVSDPTAIMREGLRRQREFEQLHAEIEAAESQPRARPGWGAAPGTASGSGWGRDNSRPGQPATSLQD